MKDGFNSRFIRIAAIVSGILVLVLLTIATTNIHNVGLGFVVFAMIPFVFVAFAIVVLITALSTKNQKSFITPRPAAAAPQEERLSTSQTNPPSLFSQRNRNIVYIICLAILAIHVLQTLYPAPPQEGLGSAQSAGDGILGAGNSLFTILVVPPILIACIASEKSRKRGLFAGLLLLVWIIAVLTA